MATFPRGAPFTEIVVATGVCVSITDIDDPELLLTTT
jgi:hypothetical protein